MQGEDILHNVKVRGYMGGGVEWSICKNLNLEKWEVNRDETIAPH